MSWAGQPGRPASAVATWTRDDVLLAPPALAVGVFAALSIVEVLLFGNRPGERQHAGRALSESTKPLPWRLAIIAHPFPIARRLGMCRGIHRPPPGPGRRHASRRAGGPRRGRASGPRKECGHDARPRSMTAERHT
ncbi:hypothetical protein ACWD69_20565 [Micromonospora chokoriensis]